MKEFSHLYSMSNLALESSSRYNSATYRKVAKKILSSEFLYLEVQNSRIRTSGVLPGSKLESLCKRRLGKIKNVEKVNKHVIGAENIYYEKEMLRFLAKSLRPGTYVLVWTDDGDSKFVSEIWITSFLL